MSNKEGKTTETEDAATTTAKRPKNMKILADTVKVLEQVEKVGIPEKRGIQLAVYTDLKENRAWWQRRLNSLTEALTTAEATIRRFDAQIQLMDEMP